jgi:hypothetical protein
MNVTSRKASKRRKYQTERIGEYAVDKEVYAALR